MPSSRRTGRPLVAVLGRIVAVTAILRRVLAVVATRGQIAASPPFSEAAREDSRRMQEGAENSHTREGSTHRAQHNRDASIGDANSRLRRLAWARSLDCQVSGTSGGAAVAADPLQATPTPKITAAPNGRIRIAHAPSSTRTTAAALNSLNQAANLATGQLPDRPLAQRLVRQPPTRRMVERVAPPWAAPRSHATEREHPCSPGSVYVARTRVIPVPPIGDCLLLPRCDVASRHPPA